MLDVRYIHSLPGLSCLGWKLVCGCGSVSGCGSEVEVRSQALMIPNSSPVPEPSSHRPTPPAPASAPFLPPPAPTNFQQFKLISNRLHNYVRGSSDGRTDGRAKLPFGNFGQLIKWLTTSALSLIISAFNNNPVSSTILLNKEILTSAGRIIVLVGAGDEISV